MPIIDGTTSAAAALRYLEQKQQIVANNLANVSTAGFKGERVFARLLNGALPVASTGTNLAAGELETTGSAFDLAIANDGFVVVKTAAGERWSRGGSLRLDNKNQLVTADGDPLLGAKGPIVLAPDTPFEIDREGQVMQDGAVVDVLRVERAGKGESLTHQGASLFVPGATRADVPPAERELEQGRLEESNVNSMTALVDMIGVQRAYSAVQRALVELDRTHETAATQLARP
jgi:flagellar basal-body rod protein FlgF